MAEYSEETADYFDPKTGEWYTFVSKVRVKPKKKLEPFEAATDFLEIESLEEIAKRYYPQFEEELRETGSQYDRTYYERHRDEILKKRQENPTDRNEYFRDYFKKNATARAECQRRYRDKIKAGMPVKPTKEEEMNACITELFKGFNVRPLKRKN